MGRLLVFLAVLLGMTSGAFADSTNPGPYNPPVAMQIMGDPGPGPEVDNLSDDRWTTQEVISATTSIISAGSLVVIALASVWIAACQTRAASRRDTPK